MPDRYWDCFELIRLVTRERKINGTIFVPKGKQYCLLHPIPTRAPRLALTLKFIVTPSSIKSITFINKQISTYSICFACQLVPFTEPVRQVASLIGLAGTMMAFHRSLSSVAYCMTIQSM